MHIIKDGSIFDQDYYPQDKIHFILTNLYQILTFTPGFKDDKEWKELPSIQELSDYLFGEVKKFHSDAFTYKYDKDGDGQLHFYTYREIGPLSQTFVLPLEWIPGLETEIGEHLYKLLLNVLGKVAYGWSLDIIENGYNDMIISDPDEYTMREEDEHAEILLSDVAKYQNGGEANEFGKLLKRHTNTIKKTALHSKIKRFYPKNDLQKKVKEWLLKGITALEKPIGIGYYYFPFAFGDDSEEAINANDMFSYCWSFHDKINEHTEGWYESVAQNSGCIGPTIRTEYFPNKKPLQIPSEDEIRKLAKFLEHGRSIYFDRYDEDLKQKYKNRFPEDSLINILT